MLKKIKDFWAVPQKRKQIILAVLFLILIVIVLNQLFNIEKPIPEGALRVVICKNCAEKYVTRIKNISDKNDPKNKCKKCGHQLIFLWKCKECELEFPYVLPDLSDKKLKTTMQKYQAVINSRRCTQCDSLLTTPMSIDVFNKKYKLK